MRAQGCGSGRIRNVLPGFGSGIIIPDPDPTNMKTNFLKQKWISMDITLEKKKVGSFNIFTLKEGGGNLPVTVN